MNLLTYLIATTQELPRDPERVLTWPDSNKAAQKVYTSTEWMTKDDFGLDRFTPAHKWWSERVRSETGLIMKLVPTRVLEESAYSKVLRCHDSPWAIKYHAYCPSEGPVDPILIEMYFLQLLAKELPDVSHTALYMSSGSSLKSPRISAVCPDKQQVLPVRPIVRFMVTQRVGRSIHELIHDSTRLDLGKVVEMGIRMFKLVRMIHSKKVIHGDIHAGNIAYRNTTSESPDSLILIDFGRSRIGPGNLIEPRDEMRCHPFLSPWEMTEQAPPSYRDDAFRVALTMVSLVFGDQLLSDLTKQLCEQLDLKTIYWAILMEENLFRRGWTQPTTFEQETLIDQLGAVLDIIRETEYHEVPNYRSIDDELESMLAVVRGPALYSIHR